MRVLMITIYLLAAGTAGAAQDSGLDAAAQGDVVRSGSNEDTAIDSVIPELQGIVVLCAKQPDSSQFRTAWINYLKSNRVKRSELGGLIFQVINDAEAYGGNHNMRRRESPYEARDRRKRTYDMMRDTAESVTRKTR